MYNTVHKITQAFSLSCVKKIVTIFIVYSSNLNHVEQLTVYHMPSTALNPLHYIYYGLVLAQEAAVEGGWGRGERLSLTTRITNAKWAGEMTQEVRAKRSCFTSMRS